MKKLYDLATQPFYNSWVKPDDDTLRREFKVEHELKHRHDFDSVDSFLEACHNGSVITVTPAMDNSIGYRSRTQNSDQLLNLIKSYASYPKFRNENSLKQLYTRIQNNEPLDLPIVLQYEDGHLRVFSGNTRMDVAFQMGVNPEVLIIKPNL